LDNILGTQTFQTKQAPGYISGKISIMATLVATSLVIVVRRLYNGWLSRKNKKVVDQMRAEEKNDMKSLFAFADMTDRKNPFFMYTH
jgi:hypothetical protein